MALLGNIIWFVLCGWWNFLLYGFLGCVCCITIIGIPIGKALFQYAKLMVFPFGKVIVKETDIKGKENVAAVRRVGGTIANILWLPAGVIGFILNIGLMIACAVTIIGIPVAVVIAKSCTFLLWPVGARVITKQEAETLRMEQSMMKVMGTAMAVGNMTAQTAPAIPEDRQTSGVNLMDSIQANPTVERAKLNLEYIAAAYLEYIVAAVGLFIIIVSLILKSSTGMFVAVPVIIASAVFGAVKQNHIVVYAALGIEIVANLVFFAKGGYMLNLLLVVCFAGGIAAYTIVCVDKTGNMKEKLLQQTAALQDKIGKATTSLSYRLSNKPKDTVPNAASNTAAAGKRFCGNCGAACGSEAKFCPKCGQAVSR